jgi:hypothetical protein
MVSVPVNKQNEDMTDRKKEMSVSHVPMLFQFSNIFIIFKNMDTFVKICSIVALLSIPCFLETLSLCILIPLKRFFITVVFST